MNLASFEIIYIRRPRWSLRAVAIGEDKQRASEIAVYFDTEIRGPHKGKQNGITSHDVPNIQIPGSYVHFMNTARVDDSGFDFAGKREGGKGGNSVVVDKGFLPIDQYLEIDGVVKVLGWRIQ